MVKEETIRLQSPEVKSSFEFVEGRDPGSGSQEPLSTENSLTRHLWQRGVRGRKKKASLWSHSVAPNGAAFQGSVRMCCLCLQHLQYEKMVTEFRTYKGLLRAAAADANGALLLQQVEVFLLELEPFYAAFQANDC